MLSLLGLFNATELVRTSLNRLSGVLPQSVIVFVEKQIIPITESQADKAFTLVAIVSLLLALWGVSGAFRSVMQAMNVMYEVEEDRPAWKKYGISTFISLAVIVLTFYIYYSAVILLIGAEVNQMIEWHIPGGKS